MNSINFIDGNSRTASSNYSINAGICSSINNSANQNYYLL